MLKEECFDCQTALLQGLSTIISNYDACDYPSGAERCSHVLANFEEFFSILNLLADEASKKIYIDMLLLYISTGFFAKDKCFALFPIINSEEWARLEKNAKSLQHPYIRDDYLLDRIETWILHGYSYGEICKALPGDFVIDGGAHTGNTGFYFRGLVGDSGKVYSFEPSGNIFEKLKSSIEKAGITNIIPVNAALADYSGTASFAATNSPAARFSNSENSVFVSVVTIDDFIDNVNEKIDFIKLDVEGAEAEALKGAKKTIKKYSPKMAVCVYHKATDPFRLPRLILEINPNYTFYLKHNSNGLAETVLFCQPNMSRSTRKDDALPPFARSFRELLHAWYKLKENQRRETFFNRINDLFRYLLDIQEEFIINPSVNYMFLPFSKNRDNHYEVIVLKKSISVAVHFERFKENLSNSTVLLIRKFFKELQLTFPQAAIDESHRLAFSFTVECKYDRDTIEYIACLLKSLIQSTLGKFWELSLLTPKLSIYHLEQLKKKDSI